MRRNVYRVKKRVYKKGHISDLSPTFLWQRRTKDVKLLILDKETVTKLIDEIIDPLMMNKNKSVNGSMTYYYYIKLYLKYELDMLNCTELRDLNKVKSTGVDGNYPTEHFLSSFAEKMGFDGVIHIGRKGIYKYINGY